jgi:hypothetical protein
MGSTNTVSRTGSPLWVQVTRRSFTVPRFELAASWYIGTISNGIVTDAEQDHRFVFLWHAQDSASVLMQATGLNEEINYGFNGIGYAAVV